VADPSEQSQDGEAVKTPTGPFPELRLFSDLNVLAFVLIFLSLLSCFSTISCIADQVSQFRMPLCVFLAFVLLLQVVVGLIKRDFKKLRFGIIVATSAALILNVISVAVTTMVIPGVNQSQAEIEAKLKNCLRTGQLPAFFTKAL
jgi:hypothetical protein